MIFKETQYQHILKLETNIKGPTAMILGGVHGDEIPGIKTYHWLKEEFLKKQTPTKGTLYIALGNPRAVQVGQRYTEVDLNRQFSNDKIEITKNTPYEIIRAQELQNIIKKTDYLLDLHATSKPSDTIAVSNKKGLEICKKFHVKNTLTGWSKIIGHASTFCFQNTRGGIGIGLECGYTKNPKAFTFAKNSVLIFLEALEMLPPQNLENERIPEHIKVISGIFPKTEHFKFTKNYHHLDPIRKDEIYATDGDKEYKVKENTVMLLPFKKIRPNQEAGYIGKIVE